MSADNSISLNKFISQTGICSRREADKWIEAGRVKLNGIVAQKGNRVLPNDTVLVDNRPILTKPKSVYLALHKPPGITCTTDQKDKTNIIDFINYPKRIFPIGRLDKPSTGLILLTNDGDIVNAILRAENNHEKEYIVTVNRPITSQFIKKMSGGLPILGTKTKRCKVERLNKFTFKIILTQGLNRQIRRMCAFLQYQVVTLKRIRIMHIHLGNLKVGKWRYLTAQEFDKLQMALRKK
ncbi:MAG: pseudouridine synthase [Bacteroidota bacterium]